MATFGDPPITIFGDPAGYTATTGFTEKIIEDLKNTSQDYEEVLRQVKEMLDDFWLHDDPLLRFNTVLAAQRRIESVL